MNNLKLFLTPVVYTFFTLFLFTFDFEESDVSIKHIDKFFHFIIFLFLYFVWFYTLNKKYRVSKSILLLFLSLYALLIELIQLKLTYRSFEILDIFFNIIGLVVSVFSIRFLEINFKK